MPVEDAWVEVAHVEVASGVLLEAPAPVAVEAPQSFHAPLLLLLAVLELAVEELLEEELLEEELTIEELLLEEPSVVVLLPQSSQDVMRRCIILMPLVTS